MKFIDSKYIPETGISVVTIEHMGVLFYGHAYAHPEDKDTANEYVGCTYAEIRAEIKALKYERKILKDKCEECRKFIRACEGYKGFDKSSPTARALYRQLNRRIKKVNQLADEINELSRSISKHDFQRHAFLNHIKNKKSKEDNQ